MTPMYTSQCGVIALIVLIAITSTSADRICFIAATIPWTFGAYQSQLLGLTQAFAAAGHETFWMPRFPVKLPAGEEFASWKEALKAFNADVRYPTKTEQRAVQHLKFLGFPKVHAPYADVNAMTMTIQHLEQAVANHKIDAFILLVDIGQMYLDSYMFPVPTVLWMPYHHEEADSSAAVVGTYSAVAALSNTTGKAIAEAQPLTRTIPHFIDRTALNKLADAFEAKVSKSQPNRPIREAVFDSEKYDRMFTRTIDKVADDTFLVLMQGGNYENSDRKGWVASINAFAKFQRANPTIKTHLWLHAIDSTMTQAELNHKSKPPVSVVRTGVSLRAVLQRAGISESTYTLDENLHGKTLTSALKRHADVCLHTSKSEGFGMVVMECQALGTPVITTNYTAMRDYTKYGIAVEIAERESIQGAYYAVPSVSGGANALTRIATGAAELTPLEDVYQWIDSELSLSTVYTKFASLLAEAKVVHAALKPWSVTDTFNDRPIFTVTTDEYPRIAEWDTPWTLYHHPDVVVDYAAIQGELIRGTLSEFKIMAIKLTTKDGKALSFDPQDSVHNINPMHVVVVRTWMLRQFQEVNAYIWSSVFQIMQTCSDKSFFLPLKGPPARLDAAAGKAAREVAAAAAAKAQTAADAKAAQAKAKAKVDDEGEDDDGDDEGDDDDGDDDYEYDDEGADDYEYDDDEAEADADDNAKAYKEARAAMLAAQAARTAEDIAAAEARNEL